MSGGENPYETPKAELKPIGYDWDASDRVLLRHGVKKTHLRSAGHPLMIKLGISHRPPMYLESRRMFLFAGILASLATLYLLVALGDVVAGDYGLTLMVVLPLWFGSMLMVGLNCLFNWIIRKRHKLPSWSDFRQLVEIESRNLRKDQTPG